MEYAIQDLNNARRVVLRFLQARGHSMADLAKIPDRKRVELAAGELKVCLTGFQKRKIRGHLFLLASIIGHKKLDRPLTETKRSKQRPLSRHPEEQWAPSQAEISKFYESWEWARLSYRAKKRLGRRCINCGKTPEDGVKIVTDHVLPIRRYWHLRLDEGNLQILCDGCNRGKGSWDETDFRHSAA